MKNEDQINLISEVNDDIREELSTLEKELASPDISEGRILNIIERLNTLDDVADGCMFLLQE
jgi:hypothetical protein